MSKPDESDRHQRTGDAAAQKARFDNALLVALVAGMVAFATSLITTYMSNQNQTELLQQELQTTRLEQAREQRRDAYLGISAGLDDMAARSLSFATCENMNRFWQALRDNQSVDPPPRPECEMPPQDVELSRQFQEAKTAVAIYGSDQAVAFVVGLPGDPFVEAAFSRFSGLPGVGGEERADKRTLSELAAEWRTIMREELAVCRSADCS